MTLRDDLRAYRRKVAEAIAFGDPTEGRPGALRDARKVAELGKLERTDTLPALYETCPHGRGWGACGECRRDPVAASDVRRPALDERLDARGYPLCSHCHVNSREVRDLCGQCWRAHEARQHELDYQRAQEDADS